SSFNIVRLHMSLTMLNIILVGKPCIFQVGSWPVVATLNLEDQIVENNQPSLSSYKSPQMYNTEFQQEKKLAGRPHKKWLETHIFSKYVKK
ncbi:hypothetical protein L9F63_005414, partial [Diploptera punctata]